MGVSFKIKTSAYVLFSNFEWMIVSTILLAPVTWDDNQLSWLVTFIFLPVDAENILPAHFSSSPSHLRDSPDVCLIGCSHICSLCRGRLNQHTSLLVILIWGRGISSNSVMIRFSSALLLFSVVVGFVMSADIIFLWHTYHLHAHKALKVLIIFS